MKSIFISLATLCCVAGAYAQTNIVLHITDSKTKEPVVGVVVNIEQTTIGSSADTSGLVYLTGIPAGKNILHYRMLGYAERYDTLEFPLAQDTLNVSLEAAADEEMEEVVVSSTRSGRTIQATPTRIEVISGEELEEKANMKPGDIRMLLAESTGIQTLQTSATSGNSSIRIEGLDGRYTQILKDGFPLYAGFSGGLGLLQTPPLDLKRVEIIKGSSSTLYGGGAIAGLVNLISKTPSETRELELLTNATSAKGLDLNAFYSQRFGKIGATLYTAYNANAAYAPGNTIFTAIPRVARTTFNPRFFLYPSKQTDIIIGLNSAFETRLGGDIHYILNNDDSTHTYYENNKSTRISSQAELRHRFGSDELTVKNSVGYFKRTINTPFYAFDGTQTNIFSEASYLMHRQHAEWIFGANYYSDGFREAKLSALPLRNYLLTVFGAFAQNTWDINRQLILETGLRSDVVTSYGLAVLPRVSLLFKPTEALSSRVGGGLGYKAPTIFTEESERINYQNVLPVSPDSNNLERSWSGNWDVNYRTTIGAIRINFNQLVFYTRLDDPLELIPVASDLYRFENVSGHIDATGTETNLRATYKHVTLFLGYTFTHSHLHHGNMVQESFLTPKHHTNTVIMYELEGKLKIGAEAYYYSSQLLSDGTRGRDYWLCGLMGEKIWKKFSVYINFENMLNIRQTRFGSIYTGSITDPKFKDIYAPLDGFVMNGGIKLHL